MMAQLRGVLIHRHQNTLLLLVNDSIGYELKLPQNELDQLPPTGQPLSLWVHTIHKEDEIQGYGFHQAFSRELFRTLLRGGGVGAKIALNLMGTLSLQEIYQSIVMGQADLLQTKVSGIGARLAARLHLELAEPVQKLFQLSGDRFGTVDQPSPPNAEAFPEQEAIGALLALGYKADAARHWVAQARQRCPNACTAEAILKAALQLVKTA